MTALYESSDYAQALAALRPQGKGWPGDPASTQLQVLGVLAPTAARIDASAQGLLVDAFPATSVDLLPEWEASLALDPASEDTAERQAAVVARLVAVSGQSKQDFIDYAAGLGFTIEIETYAPLRCGIARCGDMLGGPEWSFAWSITVTANIGDLTNEDLLEQIQTIAPAETTVFLTS